MKGRVRAEIAPSGRGVQVNVDCRGLGSLLYISCGVLRAMQKYSPYGDDTEAFLDFVCKGYRDFIKMDKQEIEMKGPWAKRGENHAE